MRLGPSDAEGWPKARPAARAGRSVARLALARGRANSEPRSVATPRPTERSEEGRGGGPKKQLKG